MNPILDVDHLVDLASAVTAQLMSSPCALLPPLASGPVKDEHLSANSDAPYLDLRAYLLQRRGLDFTATRFRVFSPVA
jgi:hypothetical protein